MSDEDDYDYPSDSSSEEHYETEAAVDVETTGPNEVEAQVDSVFDLLPTDLAGADSMDATKRADINEALLKLERMNPTDDPAFSPLLNGVWTLRYAGGYSNEWALPSPTRQLALFLYSGGYSPGLFALSLAQKLPKALVELGELEICKLVELWPGYACGAHSILGRHMLSPIQHMMCQFCLNFIISNLSCSPLLHSHHSHLS